MEKDLLRLERWLRENRPEYLSALQPGLSSAELDDFDAWLGFKAPAAFRTLYSWRNGQRDDNFAAFQFNRSLMNLAGIRESITCLNELLELGEFEGSNWWSRRWIPFLDNGGGDHWCIDPGPSFDGARGQIVEFWHDDADRTIVFPDLAAWLKGFVETLEAGMWELDEHENFTVNESKKPAYRKVAEAIAPGYPIHRTA